MKMENVYRLRPVNWIRELGLPIISLTLLAALVWLTAGESTIQKTIITLFLLAAGFHLVLMLRLGNAMHLIPFTFYLGGSLVLIIPDNMFFFLFALKNDYQEETYLRIDHSGKVSVQISNRAYRQYQEKLSFDQLCLALGDLFRKFYASWSRGNKYKVINMMDELKLIT